MNTLRVLVAAILFLSQTVPANVKTIRNDEGGLIVDYIREASRLEKSGEPVIIDGNCLSACTVFLNTRNTCVTLRARLGFHSAWGGPARQTSMVNKFLMAIYPPKVRAWIKARGGLTSKLLVLEGKELIGKVRICKG